MFKQIKRWLLLGSLLVLLAVFFYFDLHRTLSFESLKAHRALLLAWSGQHFMIAILGYMAFYTVVVACSIPGATLLTLMGGFLFGPILGTLLVVISATVGAFIIFIAVSFALRDWVSKKAAKWLKVMEQGFQKNAFSYLLFLRFVPLFPFWLVNIVPALLGVSPRIFVIATFVGIIPGSFVYATVGSGLGHILDVNGAVSLDIVFDPQVFLPLLGLGLLSLLPIGYKFFKKGKEKHGTNSL